MNPLQELKTIIGSDKSKKYIAIVDSLVGTKVRIRTGNSTSLVWGKAKVGDTVMVRDSQVIAIINPEVVQTVYVP